MTSDINTPLKDRHPDVKLEVWLVPHGLQANLHIGSEHKWGTGWCFTRDFVDDKDVREHINVLDNMIYEMLKEFSRR